MEAEHCSNCEQPIAHAPVYFDGKPYCCVGCVAGGPCLCTYEEPQREQRPAPRPVLAGAAAPSRASASSSMPEDPRPVPPAPSAHEAPHPAPVPSSVIPPVRPSRPAPASAAVPPQRDEPRRSASDPREPIPFRRPGGSPIVVHVAGFADQRQLLTFAGLMEQSPEFVEVSLTRVSADEAWLTVRDDSPEKVAEQLRRLPGFALEATVDQNLVEARVGVRRSAPTGAPAPETPASHEGAPLLPQRPRFRAFRPQAEPRTEPSPAPQAAPRPTTPPAARPPMPQAARPPQPAPQPAARPTAPQAMPPQPTAQPPQPTAQPPQPTAQPPRPAEQPVRPISEPAQQPAPQRAPRPVPAADAPSTEAPVPPTTQAPPAAPPQAPAASPPAEPRTTPRPAAPAPPTASAPPARPAPVAPPPSQPAPVAAPPTAAPMAPPPAAEDEFVEPEDRPGGAVMTVEHLTLVVYPFHSFAALNEFQAAIRELHGVKNTRVRRFYRGTLHLAVDYEDMIPLSDRLADLRGVEYEIASESRSELEIVLQDTSPLAAAGDS